MKTISWSLSGAVLAGGESRRMGRDKAQVEWRGEPLWLRQTRILGNAGAADVAVVRRHGQARLDGGAGGVPCLYDLFEGAGPLAGLEVALAHCRTRWLAVLAVDMAQIDAAWFRWLGSFCRPGVGAVARTTRGFEPLAAIYPREALPIVVARLRAGERSLQSLLTSLVNAHRCVAAPLPAAQYLYVANWNSANDCPVDAHV